MHCTEVVNPYNTAQARERFELCISITVFSVKNTLECS